MKFKFRKRIYRYRRIIFSAILVLIISFIIWLINLPTTFEKAKEQLAIAATYGEVKWAWLEYKNHLGDNKEWQKLIDHKLSGLTLDANQKSDLGKWYQSKKYADQANSTGEQTKISLVRKEVPAFQEDQMDSSSLNLAKFYNQQGDEKCKAFKAAQAPQLYHIANEYYQYAATLTHSNPKVCE